MTRYFSFVPVSAGIQDAAVIKKIRIALPIAIAVRDYTVLMIHIYKYENKLAQLQTQSSAKSDNGISLALVYHQSWLWPLYVHVSVHLPLTGVLGFESRTPGVGRFFLCADSLMHYEYSIRLDLHAASQVILGFLLCVFLKHEVKESTTHMLMTHTHVSGFYYYI